METNSNQLDFTYLFLLKDTLKKKLKVLSQLLDLTQLQEDIIGAPNFNEEQFLQTITSKEEKIQTLNKLDHGFEQVFDRVRDELFDHKYQYETDINELKELIKNITDLSVKLQAMEMRNKSKLEGILSMKRKEIKNSRLSNETVTNYYKAMAKQEESQSYFYDTKK